MKKGLLLTALLTTGMFASENMDQQTLNNFLKNYRKNVLSEITSVVPQIAVAGLIGYKLNGPQPHPVLALAGVHQKHNGISCVDNATFHTAVTVPTCLKCLFFEQNNIPKEWLKLDIRFRLFEQKTLLGSDSFPIVTKSDVMTSLFSSATTAILYSGNTQWRPTATRACKAAASAFIGNKVIDVAKGLNKRFNLIDEDSTFYNTAVVAGNIAAYYYASKLVNKIAPDNNFIACWANGQILTHQELRDAEIKVANIQARMG